jgi:XTP/dITP diphosphohydrolase
MQPTSLLGSVVIVEIMPLLFASSNPHKVQEVRAILAPCGIDVIGLDSLDVPPPEPEETGATFEENARIKAIAYARATGQMCLADDSGLEVDALGGAPGVISARYAAGPPGSTGAPHNVPTPPERRLGEGARGVGELPNTPSPPAPLARGEAGSRVRQSMVSPDLFQPMTRQERDAANNAKLLGELKHVSFEQRTARFVCAMCLADPQGNILAETRGTFEGLITDQPAGTNGFGYDPLLYLPDRKCTSAELSPTEKNARSHRGQAARKMAAVIKSLATFHS